MKCEYCGNEIPAGSATCPACGAAAPAAPASQTVPQDSAAAPGGAKSRAVYVLLGILAGWLGLHDFYAGRNGRGAAKLLITLLSAFAFAPVSAIWALVDVCTTDKDAKGAPMA